MRSSAFVSYSHQDRKWLDRLTTMLAPLVRGGLKIWSDQQLQPGTPWREGIKTALSDAKVAILLVSPGFLASDFIDKHELPPLLKDAGTGELVILWIPVQYSNYQHSPIADYQAAWDPARPLASLTASKRDQALVAISGVISEAMKA